MKRLTIARSWLMLPLLVLLASCDLFVDDATRVERARVHLDEGSYRAAVIELKNVLRNDPENIEARALLGEVLVGQGDAAGATKELTVAREKGASADLYMVPLAEAMLREAKFSEVVALNPEQISDPGLRARLLALIGRAEYSRGNSGTARRRFEQALELDPEQSDALVGMARIARERGDLEGAGEVLQQLVESGTADHAALGSLGQLQFDQRDYDKAVASFRLAFDAADSPGLLQERMGYLQGIIESQLALGDKAAARGTAQELLRVSNEHPLALLQAARVDMLSSDYDAVMDKAQRLIALAPDLEPARLMMAGAAMAKNNYALAGTHLQVVVNNNPANEQARKLLAQVRMSQGSPDEALEVLQPLLRGGSGDAQLLAMVGTASIRQGDEQAGLEFLERGVEMAADDPAILTQAAANFLAAGEVNRAIELLESLPESEQVQQSDMLLILAMLRKEEFDAARSKAQALVDSRPGDPAAYEAKGAFHMAVKELEQARESFSRALQIDPQRVAAVVNLARIDIEQGNLDAAESRFRDALKVQPGNPTMLIALAQLAERRGQPEEGVKLLEESRAANPEAPAAPLILANYYLRTGKLELAADRAAQAVRNAPGNGRAHMIEGVILFESGRYNEAQQKLARAIEVTPNLALAYLHLGRTYERLDDDDGALAAYQQALDRDASLYPAQAAIAAVAARRGDYGTALEAVDKLIEGYPERAEPQALRGDIQVARGDLDAALAAYEKAAELQPSGLLVSKMARVTERLGRPGALQMLQDWVADHPDDNATRTNLGRAYLAGGRFEDGVQQLSQVMQQAPAKEVALLLASAHESRQQYDKALQWIDRAIALDPGPPEYKVARGRLQLRQQQPAAALVTARELRRSAPDNPAVLELEGDALLASKDFSAAASAFEQAARLQPSGQLAIKTYRARKEARMDNPARVLTRWLDEHPGETSVALVLAQHHQEEGRLDDAVAAYRRVLEANPSDPIVLNNLAWLYMERRGTGDMARAVSAAEKAYQQQSAAAIADTYGWVLVQDGQVEKALPLLQKAAQDLPVAEIRYHYAVALHRNGRVTDARTILGEVLDSGEDFTGRIEAQQLYKELGG